MRLGAPLYEKFNSPDEWVSVLRAHGHAAAYCPVDDIADDATVRAYSDAARRADVVIGEVGAWWNVLDRNSERRRENISKVERRLALADRIGANCCVNIAGSLGDRWDGPSAEDLDPATFDLIVESVRSIIDSVRPTRTFYALETMPWMAPSSPDEYLRLIRAVDRKQLGVHLDPTNMMNTPQRVLRNAEFTRECFEKLGPHIKAVHIKDVSMQPKLVTMIEEVRPGLGTVDYPAMLRAAEHVDADLPLLLEHLPQAQDYELATAYVRQQLDKAAVVEKHPR